MATDLYGGKVGSAPIPKAGPAHSLLALVDARKKQQAHAETLKNEDAIAKHIADLEHENHKLDSYGRTVLQYGAKGKQVVTPTGIVYIPGDQNEEANHAADQIKKNQRQIDNYKKQLVHARAVSDSMGPRAAHTPAGFVPGLPTQSTTSVPGGTVTFGGPAPTAPIDPAQSGPTGPSIPQLSAPSMASYVGPYDQAQSALQQVYAPMQGDISSQYAALRNQLAAAQGAQDAKSSQIIGDQTARQAQLMQQIQGMQAPATADLHAQGDTPTSLVQQIAAQSQQSQQQTADASARQQRYLADLQAANAQSNAGRVSDTQTAEANAKLGTQSTYDQLLGQIAMQKANAQRQYASDANDTAIKNFQLQQSASGGGGNPIQDALTQAKLQGQLLDNQSKATGLQTKASGGFDLPSIAKKYPTAYQTFDQLTGLANTDYNTAVTDGTKGLNPFTLYQTRINNLFGNKTKLKVNGKSVDKATLMKWGQQFYKGK